MQRNEGGGLKDFLFWRGSIYNSKTLLILKSVGEELAQFQQQTALFGDDETKLTEGPVTTLRGMYSEKLKKLELESLSGTPPIKPKFNK
jgi:hypothetical protein